MSAAKHQPDGDLVVGGGFINPYLEVGEGALDQLEAVLPRAVSAAQAQTLTSRVRIPVESIQTREALLTILARTLSQCGQRRTMPAPR